jgi:hypothetical protein
MEHLHKLVNGIYNLKEHMTDNEYLEMMTSINKLNEIISSYDNDTESYYSDDDYEEEYIEEEEEIEVTDVDLLLEIINNNEIVFNNYLNNLSADLKDDFISSKFNVINQTAYNYITNKTCNCQNEIEVCDNIDNLYSCKNYQSFILQCPIVHLIVKRKCPCCNDKIIDDINKYKLFEFDGKIKFNNIEETIFKNKIASLMNMMPKLDDNKYRVLLFICIYYYIFTNGNIIINNNNFKEAIFNKLQTDGKKETAITYIPYWSNIFNFDKNIIDIMINNLQSLGHLVH